MVVCEMFFFERSAIIYKNCSCSTFTYVFIISFSKKQKKKNRKLRFINLLKNVLIILFKR